MYDDSFVICLSCRNRNGFIAVCSSRFACASFLPAQEKAYFRPAGIICGLICSFTFFTLALTAIVHLTGISPNFLRYIADWINRRLRPIDDISCIGREIHRGTFRSGRRGSIRSSEIPVVRTRVLERIYPGNRTGFSMDALRRAHPCGHHNTGSHKRSDPIRIFYHISL